MKDTKAIKIEQIAESKGDVTFFAIVKIIRKKVTKKSQMMAFISAYDETSEIELTVFPDTYLESEKALKKNNIIVVTGYQKYDGDFSVKTIRDIKEFIHE